MSPEHNAPPLRALIYNRVSADPTGRRISVESQDRENRAFCERQGWEIVGTITDNDRSASRFAARQREGYQRVLAALDGNSEFGRVDVLVAWESSRGERRLEGYVQLRGALEANGVLYAYKGRVNDMREGDDRFSTGLDALLDEREAERARERTLRSHRFSVEKGTPRGVAPYGYRREYDPASGRMVAQVVDPETGPVVVEIVRRVLGGDTLYAIAQDLNRRGIDTPRASRDRRAGKEPDRPGWSSSMIRNLLRKPSIAGMRSHHDRVVGEASWPALVPQQDWAALQGLLAEPGRVRNERGVAPRHLLSGIAECGVCGAWLRPLRNRGRMTYVCGGSVPTAGKGHVSAAAEPLEELVTLHVVLRLSSAEFRERLNHQEPDADVAAAVAEVRALKAQLAEVAVEVRARRMTPALAGRIEAGLLADIEAAERRATPRWVPREVLDMAGPDAATAWGRAGLERKRRVLRALQRVRLHRALVVGKRGFDPERVEFVDLVG